MSDLISRQAAIDAIGEKSDEIYKTKQKGATYPHDDFFQGMAYAENIVKQLPSAQPEQNILSWLLTYHKKSFDLRGRYMANEVIGWLVHDFANAYMEERREE